MDFPRALLIFALFIGVYIVSQIYLFFRLRDYLQSRVKDPRKRRLVFGLAGIFLALMLSPFLWRLFISRNPLELYPWAARPLLDLFTVWGFGSPGCALVLLSYDLYRRAGAFFSSRTTTAPDLGRREFLKIGAGMAAAAPFIFSGYGVLLGRSRFQVEEFDLPVSGLSSSLSELSVVQLTDIHVGPFMPEEELMAYVEAANRLEPDIIAITGDFITSSLSEVYPCADALAGLKARHGVFACMGNHDVFSEADEELTRLLSKEGIRVLRNDAASVRIKDTKINILGIDDLGWGKPDLPRALKAARAEPGELGLLLSHRPEIFPRASGEGVQVVLSGHYHGGQIKLSPDPRSLSIARFMTPYAEGLFHLPRRAAPGRTDDRDAVLFVGRGIGITALPIRVNCPPQIAHLKLVKA